MKPPSTARALDTRGYAPETGLVLPALAEDNTLVVDADCIYSNTGEGLHRFVDPVDSAVYLYSQFETADAKRMYTCFDQPDLKAAFTLDGHRARRLGGGLERSTGRLARMVRAVRRWSASRPLRHFRPM